jgi:hypothetical protein
MKNKRFNGIAAILAAALALSALLTVACSKSSGNGGANVSDVNDNGVNVEITSEDRARNINSVEKLKEYLNSQPVNSFDKPIKVAMKANEMLIKNIVDAIYETARYVSLDLSGSPLTVIPSNAFFYNVLNQGCVGLVSLILPDGITSIGERAFASCTRLTSINIPDSVTSIGDRAFYNCSGLTSVTFEGTIPSSGFNYNGYPEFPGDLREKHLAGGPGTYTRESGGSTWTKK